MLARLRACENFMLALAAAGYDNCPLEGFDEPKVKRLFALTDEARVVMVIAAGRRGAHALIPQIRHEHASGVRVRGSSRSHRRSQPRSSNGVNFGFRGGSVSRSSDQYGCK